MPERISRPGENAAGRGRPVGRRRASAGDGTAAACVGNVAIDGVGARWVFARARDKVAEAAYDSRVDTERGVRAADERSRS